MIREMSRETQVALALCCAWIDFMVFAMAQMFGLEVAYSGSPIRAETYGAAVYEIPAMVCVNVQMNAALIGVIGALLFAADRRTARLGAFMIGTGNTALVVLFAIFVVLAQGAPDGALLKYMSLTVGIGGSGYFAVLGGRLFFWGDRA